MRARVARDAFTPASALAALALLLAVSGCSSRSGNPARVATGYISCSSGSWGGRCLRVADYVSRPKATRGAIAAGRVRELATLSGRIRATEYRLYRLLETSHAT